MTHSTNAPLPAFASAFPPAEEAQWRLLVDKVLKGGKFDRLVGRTADDIAIQPLYSRATADKARAFSQAPGRWDVLARIDHTDPAQANAQAKADLAEGATGLQLVFAGTSGAHGFGLPADGLNAALEGIDPAAVTFELDLSPAAKAAPDALASMIVASGLNPASARVSFGFDPIGVMLAGGDSLDFASIADDFAAKIASFAAQGFTGPFCVADGRAVHAGGGSEAQELAFVLSSALAYLRALEASGDTLDQARRKVSFRIVADADQFLTIAKLRALRGLWARVEDVCGVTPEPASIHAETAWRMMSRRDPSVNLLRSTVAVFSAAVGGADRISVLPHTQTLGLPDDVARRLARNTQLILLEEAHVARVADPAAGSGGIEALTDELSREAWTLFQKLEAQGGAGAAAVRAELANEARAIHARRLKAIATRREPLTGVSEFPNIHEAAPNVLAPLPSLTKGPGLDPVRNADMFEALRDRAEAGAVRPKVFLGNYGPIAAFNARATFARNLFEAGGIEAVSNEGFSDARSMADAFKASGARIACICSSDALYTEGATACAAALKAAGATLVYLAGRAGEDEAAQRAAGVDRYAFAGCDAAALLDEALKAAD